MRRFKSTFFHFGAWSRASANRAARAMRSIRASGSLVPATRSSFWSARDSEHSHSDLHVSGAAAPRVKPAELQTKGDRIHDTFAGFALWLGLLISAALIGTFFVIGTVVIYALIMSLMNH